MDAVPAAAPPVGPRLDWSGEDLIRVDEYRDGDHLVIRAEMPGIDPEKDVEVTVVGEGVMRINAERKVAARSPEAEPTKIQITKGRPFRSTPSAHAD